MITISRCERFAVKYGVPPEVIENDYMTEWILSSIAGDDELKSKLIFRGGIYLQKVYFENYKFSEDLDFVFDAKYGVEDISSDVELMLDSMKSENREIIGWTIFMENGRIQIFIEYNVVPEIIKPEKKLKLDFCATDETSEWSERDLKFTNEESKNLKYSLKVCSLETITADKISRSIGINREARDVYDYDLKFLFEAGQDLKLLNNEFRNANHTIWTWKI